MNKEIQDYLKRQQNDYIKIERMYKNKIFLLILIWAIAIISDTLLLVLNILHHNKILILNVFALVVFAFGIKLYFRMVDKYKAILKNKKNLLKRLEKAKMANQEAD